MNGSDGELQLKNAISLLTMHNAAKSWRKLEIHFQPCAEFINTERSFRKTSRATLQDCVRGRTQF